LLDLSELSIPEFADEELSGLLEETKGRARVIRDRRRHRQVSGGIAAVVVVGLAVALVSLQVAAGPAKHVASGWRLVGDIAPGWHTVPSSGFDTGVSLVCPSSQTCYALYNGSRIGSSAELEMTTDGGSQWQAVVLPAAYSGSSNLSCPDEATCALVARTSAGATDFYETVDSGQSWTVETGPTANGTFSLSCTDATDCVAAQKGAFSSDDSTFSTSDAGSTWRQTSLPTNFVPDQVQCNTDTDCAMVGSVQLTGLENVSRGEILDTTDGGSTWAVAVSPALPSSAQVMGYVDCARTIGCMASFFEGNVSPTPSTSVVLTSSDGHTWSLASDQGLPAEWSADGIACATASQCWLSGSQLEDQKQLGPGRIGIPAAFAEAVITATSTSGDSWQGEQLPPGLEAVSGMSCPTSTSCFAIGWNRAGSPVFLSGS
jgi:hypothetical protein